MTGTLAATLAHEGLFDPEARVADDLPELCSSGFGDATIRQLMDMTTALRLDGNEAAPASPLGQYNIALGWRARPEAYVGAENSYEYLPTMPKHGEHGACFAYITPNTDVLAWLIRRVGHTITNGG